MKGEREREGLKTEPSEPKRTKGHLEQDKKKIENSIQEIDNKVKGGNSTLEERRHLSTLNEQLTLIRKEELKGAYVRSRADRLEHGEKPSKFFLNLENKKQGK